MNYNKEIYINKRKISLDTPTYFIADIASNHDGDLNQAKELIWQAKEAGADAVKFQHFLADKIVSDYGFKHLGKQAGHQAAWKKSVFDVYRECECKRSWSQELADTAKQAKIDFMTTPYDVEAVNELDKYIPAYKIGSGDITWIDFIQMIAGKNKPVLLATGASDMCDVARAVEAIININRNIVLMQCNTNYTGSLENFKYINLNVLKTFSTYYPNMILGLSDHTPGHATVLGAIALGARVIEKHFTIDNKLVGPDHAFSMNPHTWREMVDRSRELELAMGNGQKVIEENESETVILQRRCMRFKHDMTKGQIVSMDDVEALRPAPEGAVLPYMMSDVVGAKLKESAKSGAALMLANLDMGDKQC